MIARLICRLFGHAAADCTVTCYMDETGKRTWQCPRCGDVVEGRQARWGWLVRDVHHSEMLPRGYGVAWVDWKDHNATCMPVPLNLVAGAARRAWFWCKAPRFLYQDPRAAYFLGLRHGREQAAKGRQP